MFVLIFAKQDENEVTNGDFFTFFSEAPSPEALTSAILVFEVKDEAVEIIKERHPKTAKNTVRDYFDNSIPQALTHFINVLNILHTNFKNKKAIPIEIDLTKGKGNRNKST